VGKGSDFIAASLALRKRFERVAGGVEQVFRVAFAGRGRRAGRDGRRRSGWPRRSGAAGCRHHQRPGQRWFMASSRHPCPAVAEPQPPGCAGSDPQPWIWSSRSAPASVKAALPPDSTHTCPRRRRFFSSLGRGFPGTCRHGPLILVGEVGGHDHFGGLDDRDGLFAFLELQPPGADALIRETIW